MPKTRKRAPGPIRGGNVPIEPAYDPFPKNGLVKQHEQLIRAYVKKFCRRYPSVGMSDALITAVGIGAEAERTFKPKSGKFATFLLAHLRGLNRWARLEHKDDRLSLVRFETKAAKARREAREQLTRKTDTAADLDLSGGGNGARLIVDRHWTTPTALLEVGTVKVLSPAKRHRIKFGVQLNSADAAHAIGVAERVSASADVVLSGQSPGPTLSGRMRAVLAHQERRQREIEAEARNPQSGPVFLEVALSGSAVSFPTPKHPPDFRPRYFPVARLDEVCAEDDGWRIRLYETISAGRQEPDRWETLVRAADMERPFLSVKELHMLDWLFNPRGRSQEQAGAEIGIRKSYASRMITKIKAAIKKNIRK